MHNKGIKMACFCGADDAFRLCLCSFAAGCPKLCEKEGRQEITTRACATSVIGGRGARITHTRQTE